jgi:hypothetical protein
MYISPYQLSHALNLGLRLPIAGGNIKVSAGTLSSARSDITFSNSNGVSFGLNGAGMITAIVATNYQAPGAYLTTAQPPGAYLTTAALSGDTSKYAGTSTGIAGGSVTLNTAGISLSLPAYLTTFSYPRLDQVLNPTSDVFFSFSTGQQIQFQFSNVGAFTTNANKQGLFEIDCQGNLTDGADVLHVHQSDNDPSIDLVHIEGWGTNVTCLRLEGSCSIAAEINRPLKFTALGASSTAIGSVPFIMGTVMSNVVANLNANYLQGRVSTQFAGLGFSSTTTAGTDIKATLSTNGLNMAVPAYLTTAAVAGAGTGTSVVTTAGTDLSMALNTGGLTVAYPKWITTFDATSILAGTGTSVQTTAGTDLSCALNTDGLTIAYPKWLTTAGATNITSERAGTNMSVATTAGSDITLGVNTSGVTIGYPKWLTTYAAQTNQSAIQAVGVSNAGNTAGNVGYSTGINYCLAGSGSITLSQSTAAGAATAYIQHPEWLTTAAATDITSGRAGTVSGATNCSVTVNTSGVSVNVPSAPGVSTASNWANFPMLIHTTTTMCQSNTSYVVPLHIPYCLSASYIRLLGSFNFTSTSIATSAVNNATGASTAFSKTVAWNAVLYSAGQGANSKVLQYVASGSAGLTWAVSVSQQSTSNASRCSITQIITYPSEGFITANVSTQYSVTATNSPISTTQWSNLTASRYLDIPFANSVAGVNYWLAINRVSGTAGGKNMDCNASIIGMSQTNLTFAHLNAASNLSNVGPQIGLGVITLAAAGTSSSLSMSNISATTSNQIPWVQFIRQA